MGGAVSSSHFESLLDKRIAETDAVLECGLGQVFGLFLRASSDEGGGTFVDNGREHSGGHLLVESLKPRKVPKEDLEDEAVSSGFIGVVQACIDKRTDLVDGLFEIHGEKRFG